MGKYIYRVLNNQQTLSQFFSLDGKIDLLAQRETEAYSVIELFHNINNHLLNGTKYDTEFISFSTDLYNIIKKFGSCQNPNEVIRNIVTIVKDHSFSILLLEKDIAEYDNFLVENVNLIDKFVVNFNEKKEIEFINNWGLLRCKNGKSIGKSRGFNYANSDNEVICYKKIPVNSIEKNMIGKEIDIYFQLKNIYNLEDDFLFNLLNNCRIIEPDSLTKEERKFYNSHYNNNYNFYYLIEEEYNNGSQGYMQVLDKFIELKKSVIYKILSEIFKLEININSIHPVEEYAVKESGFLKKLIEERKVKEKILKRDY
ncbi:MAG: hypothetical protein PHQ64_04325 [Bacilli bacterium]|nr:hypothetical protein [Bacilli bacterium]